MRKKRTRKLLEKICPGKFGYNGGGELGITVGNRVPDFVDESNKMVVLYNGCWYHACLQCFPNGTKFSSQREHRNNIQPYLDDGYKVLVIWGHELGNIAEPKVREFIK